MTEIDLLQFPKVARSLGVHTDEHRAIARRFDKEFFDGSRLTGYGGYSYDGRWRSVALRMLLRYGLEEGKSTVLDIGCAKGFLVHDLRQLGIRAYGLDASSYAIGKSVAAHFTIREDMRLLRNVIEHFGSFDLVVSIDTLHNLTLSELARILPELKNCSSRQYITVKSFEGQEEEDQVRDLNLTAKTILSTRAWKKLFRDNGYKGDYGWSRFATVSP